MNPDWSRRRLLRRSAAGAAAILGSGALPVWAFAEELIRTPRQTEGPFYPDRLPLDTDNDLLIVNDSTTEAVGEVTHLTGRILDAKGNPVRNALVEIWQVDSKGAYLHTDSDKRDRRDKNFQGYGKFLTGVKGEYYFRTIKPVAYPGRTPHIHFSVGAKGMEKFSTQCYIKGEPRNERDGVLGWIRDERQRASVQVPFAPVAGSKIGELDARFEIVLGWTPPA